MSWVNAGVSVLLGLSLGWFLEQHSGLLSGMQWQELEWIAGCPKPQGPGFRAYVCSLGAFRNILSTLVACVVSSPWLLDI